MLFIFSHLTGLINNTDTLFKLRQPQIDVNRRQVCTARTYVHIVNYQRLSLEIIHEESI